MSVGTEAAKGRFMGISATDISQRIVENSGGRLEVTSRLGEGTTFTLRMPGMAPTRTDVDTGSHATQQPTVA